MTATAPSSRQDSSPVRVPAAGGSPDPGGTPESGRAATVDGADASGGALPVDSPTDPGGTTVRSRGVGAGRGRAAGFAAGAGASLRAAGQGARRRPLALFAAFLLLALVVLLGFMLGQVDRGEVAWSRLLLLYGSVQGVTFAALGALLGRALSRRLDARPVSDPALVAEAAAGRALAAAVRVEAGLLVPAGRRHTPDMLVSPVTPEEGATALALRLRAHADALLPAVPHADVPPGQAVRPGG